jgi:hypothetical protein
LISSSSSDDDDCSLHGYSIGSDHDSFELGIDEHGRLTSMSSWEDQNDNNQPPSTVFPRRIFHIVVLFVSDACGTARGTFVHQNSDTIYLKGAHQAMFSLLPPWSTGLFRTATAWALIGQLCHQLLKKLIFLNQPDSLG